MFTLNLKSVHAAILTFFVICLTFSQGDAQPRKKITFTDFVKALASPDTSVYRLEHVDIVSPLPLAEIIANDKSIRLTSDSLVVVDKVVSLFDCRFEKSASLSRFHFKRSFSLHSSAWTNQTVYPDELYIFMLFENRFSRGLSISFEKRAGEAAPLINLRRNSVDGMFNLITEDSYIDIRNNTFNLTAKNFVEEMHSDFYAEYDSIAFEKKQKIDFFISAEGHRFIFDDNAVNFNFAKSDEYIPSFAGLLYLNTPIVEISNNSVNSTVSNSEPYWKFDYSLQVNLKEKATSFQFTNNIVQPDMFFHLGYDLNELRYYNNKVSRVAFDPFGIPDQSNALLWSDFDKVTLGIQTGDYGPLKPFYSGTHEEVSDKLSFKELLKFYKKFYDEFKSAGDIQSSNQVYVKIKNLETRELKNSYQTDPTFNLWFRIKLNQLLNFYTAYGTDPAQALVASFWIIVVFAIFYFFFPSTWDISSKSTLIRDFKDFIEKNEKGYVKPFFKMSGGFAVSLLNAITLSLNAFVTLGFGEIPTKGAAKYITVVQGFLGWFLLSIFTVSLVSQLLF